MARSQVASDSFTYTDGGLSLQEGSSVWTEQDGSLGRVWVTSGKYNGSASNLSDCCRTSGTYSADQYSMCTLTVNSTNSTTQVGVSVRNNGAAYGSQSMYRAYYIANDDTVYLQRVNAGTPTALTSFGSQALATGDKLILEAVANGSDVDVKVYKVVSSVESQIGTTYTDSSASKITAAGRPGVCATQGSSDSFGDDWEGGDVTADAGITLTQVERGRVLGRGLNRGMVP